MVLECGECLADTKEELIGDGSSNKTRLQKLCKREKRLIRAILVLVILMNIPYGRYILYPFMLFSTWVHEMCHGIAALLMAGRISSIKIYEDGSGVCYSSLPADEFYSYRRAFVASAGYAGTAVTGGLLLLFRRTRRGPRRGVIAFAIIILLSVALFVRNTFGILVLVGMAVFLGICGAFLPNGRVGELYAFLAATCCLNAIESIKGLFGGGDSYVGGQEAQTDAQTMEEYLFLPYWFWAFSWMGLAVGMLILGLIFALKPSTPSDDYAYTPDSTGTIDAQLY